MTLLGEGAALATAVSWTGSALCFEAAGKRLGSLPVNFIRLVMAWGLLAPVAALLLGDPFPTSVPSEAAGWLALSGLVGFVFGDFCLFRAYVELGPRLTSLVMATAPMMTALLGFVALGERLGGIDVLGMLLTLTGVGTAVAARGGAGLASPHLRRGLLLALGGAVGQAGGLVLSKLGLRACHPVAATQIRVLAGIVGFAVVLLVLRRFGDVLAARRDSVGLWWTLGGSICGPCVGVTLSLLAVQHTQAGVAASIMATTPILILPAVALRGEHVGVAGVLGALVTVAGVAVLFLA